MTVFEALSLMIAFGLLVVAILFFHKKKLTSLELGSQEVSSVLHYIADRP